MLALAKQLSHLGVLGINRRNADFVLPYNDRRLYPLADDKLQSKKLALKAGIAVPDLYATIEIQRQIREIPSIFAPFREFVIKPAHGSGGDGIIVVTGRKKGHYLKASGELMTEAEMQHHISNILGGIYSLGGQADKALIEYLVKFDPVFRDITFQGVPDIRVIIFLGVPVMAMVRLPTRQSDGKANLHQGAIGAGIDIATGHTNFAVQGNENVTSHPDTENSVIDVQVPYWDEILNIASGCYELTGMGYQGVDIVLDQDKGPLMLELNVRPGLNIQIANRAGLLPRLNLVKKNRDALNSTELRVDFSKLHFCSRSFL
jgi:alpha-L-glutamate ligase-like protein